jgi:hypothetical protein
MFRLLWHASSFRTAAGTMAAIAIGVMLAPIAGLGG